MHSAGVYRADAGATTTTATNVPSAAAATPPAAASLGLYHRGECQQT
jgi:hypothetical protein